jgi:hypothetical protein
MAKSMLHGILAGIAVQLVMSPVDAVNTFMVVDKSSRGANPFTIVQRMVRSIRRHVVGVFVCLFACLFACLLTKQLHNTTFKSLIITGKRTRFAITLGRHHASIGTHA